MTKIRLTRMGKHNDPFFRVVVIDSRSKRDGEFIELVGTYDSQVENGVKLEKDIAIRWLLLGAQPSETVKNIFKKAGIWSEFLQLKQKLTSDAKNIKLNSENITKELKGELKPETKKEKNEMKEEKEVKTEKDTKPSSTNKKAKTQHTTKTAKTKKTRKHSKPVALKHHPLHKKAKKHTLTKAEKEAFLAYQKDLKK